MNRLRVLLCWCVPLLAGLHGIWFLGTGPVDDDYIIYRYARNLLAGHGLVYNPGEWVEGYTAPLWVFLHAAWQSFGGHSPQFSVWVGILAWVASVAWLCKRSWRLGEWPLEGLVVAAAPALAWHGVAGLGTTLVGLSLLGAYLSWDSAPWRSGLWFALAIALRQEMALFLIALALLAPWRAHRMRWLPGALVLGGWEIFRVVAYGQWLPMTYFTKKLSIAADLGYGVDYLFAATKNLGWAFLLALAVLGASKTADLCTRVFALGVTLHTAYVVWVGGDFMVLSRFLVPTFPVLVCLAWRDLRTRPKLAAAIAVVFALGMQWSQIGVAFSANGLPEESRTTRLLLQQGFKQRWARLGDHFRTSVPGKPKVALSPIGAFGWTSELPIVDILGLTNTSTVGVEPDLETHVKGHHRSNFDWVLDQNPEYVILGNGVRDESGRFTICPWERGFFVSLQTGGRFPKLYRQAVMDVGDGMPLDVFVRRDLTLPLGTRWVGP